MFDVYWGTLKNIEISYQVSLKSLPAITEGMLYYQEGTVSVVLANQGFQIRQSSLTLSNFEQQLK